MNKIALTLCFFFSCLNTITAQLNNEAYRNYDVSNYEDVSLNETSDATIIYDRTYINVDKIKHKGEIKVAVLNTIHRKIKINTLYGLKQYNKIYIQTFSDLYFDVEFVDCKVKTLKKGGEVVTTNSSDVITTTLPANAPFFYKQEGEVKMIAIKDINIGDEIEYVFSTRKIIDIDPEYYYKTDRISFVYDDYCIEKSLFINADKYKINLWPHNFGKNYTRSSDYSYNDGQKIVLNNIKPKSNELYSNSYFYEPYLTYSIKKSVILKNDTWEDFAKYFKPSRKKTKNKYIFDGKSINDAITEIDAIKGIKEKYEAILEKINEPIQSKAFLYLDIDDKIDIAWSYAQIISRASRKMKLPINFHFVINKNYNKLNKAYVSLYQFDDIICSFLDDDGKTYYFPLFKPFSSLNDIEKEFQGTESFTITQNELGERTHSFDYIPEFNPGKISKSIDVVLNEIEDDNIKLNIKEKLSFTGHSWIKNKTLLTYIVEDSTETSKNLMIFVKEQIPVSHKIDSIYNIKYKKNEDSFSVNYEYDRSLTLNNITRIIYLRPSDFVQHIFYTPYHMRQGRLERGYLNNEYNLEYVINFDLNKEFKWIQNDNIKNEIINDFGSLKTNFSKENNSLRTSFNLVFKKNEFEVSQWEQILALRDKAHNFFVTKFYFVK